MKTSIVNYFDDRDVSSLIDHVLGVAALELGLQDDATLSLVLLDDSQIQALNQEYRAKDAPTDVLTFPDGTDGHLGDVFVSLPTCERQAEAYGHSVDRELGFLVVHGLLHALGYDHHTDDDEQVMFDLQERILRLAKLTR